MEMQSVNRRQAEFSVNLPREHDTLEPLVREKLQAAVSRGRVTVKVAIPSSGSTNFALSQVDVEAARYYAEAFRNVGQALGLAQTEPTLDLILSSPGVIRSVEAGPETESTQPLVEEALNQALKEFDAMRGAEGENLRADLDQRVALMREALGRITRQAPVVLERYRKSLLERIRQAGLDPASLDEDRIGREIVLFADRSDISEEMTRLESHFQQYDQAREERQPVGRKLDFLAQEMNREINTIGSKANDSAIAADVVMLKTELEKFREQAQNVE